jgi:hypothetical protein
MLISDKAFTGIVKKVRHILLTAPLVLLLYAPLVHAVPIHTDYAVLFSGGANADNNRPRYYDETLRMWDISVNTLGFDPANVYVLFADGTDSGNDQCVDEGGPCSGYVNSDWSGVTSEGSTVMPATHNNMDFLLTNLAEAMTEDDSFYLWTFDHGGPGSSTLPDPRDDAILNGWGDVIRDDELAAWVDPFNVKAEIYAFGQCYSGGMADDIMALDGNNRFAAWACSGTESSWGKGWIDAWADGLEYGLRWSHDLGEYALQNDPWGPYGTGDESPGWAGRNIHIVTNQIPEPSSLLLICVGIMTLFRFQSRFRISQI